MQGESEFTIGGVLENWDISDRIVHLKIPTLVLYSEYDSVSKDASQKIVDLIETAFPLVTIPRAAHCKLIDEPLLCVNAIYRFLFTVETIRMSATK